MRRLRIGQDRDDTSSGPRGDRINSRDPGVCMWRSQDGDMRHTIEPQIVEIATRARDKACVLAPFGGITHPGDGGMEPLVISVPFPHLPIAHSARKSKSHLCHQHPNRLQYLVVRCRLQAVDRRSLLAGHTVYRGTMAYCRFRESTGPVVDRGSRPSVPPPIRALHRQSSEQRIRAPVRDARQDQVRSRRDAGDRLAVRDARRSRHVTARRCRSRCRRHRSPSYPRARQGIDHPATSSQR